MSDWDNFKESWKLRQWGWVASIVAVNIVAIGCLVGLALLALLAGLHGLDWLDALPCFCG